MDRVNAKTVLFQINDNDRTPEVYDRVESYAKTHSVENYCVLPTDTS